MRKSNLTILTILTAVFNIIWALLWGTYLVFVKSSYVGGLGYALMGVCSFLLIGLAMTMKREDPSLHLKKLRFLLLLTMAATIPCIVGSGFREGHFNVDSMIGEGLFLGLPVTLLTFVIWCFSHYSVSVSVRTRSKRTFILSLIAIVVSFTNHFIMYTYARNVQTEKQIWHLGGYANITDVNTTLYEATFLDYTLLAIVLLILAGLLNVIQRKWMSRVVDGAFILLGGIAAFISYVYPILSVGERVTHFAILAIPVAGYFVLDKGFRTKEEQIHVE